MYVYEVARRLGERGLKVDVFTRQESTEESGVVELNEHARVIHVAAGPPEPVAKEELPELVPEFAAELDSRMDDYQIVHSHYWLSGMVGRVARPAARPSRWCTPCTPWPGSRTRHPVGTRSPSPTYANRERRRSSPTRPSLTANTSDEAAELQHHYRARPEQLVVVPPGVDLHTFHPCDQPKSRAQLGVTQDAQVILFVGRIQPLKAPDVLIEAVARLVAARPIAPTTNYGSSSSAAPAARRPAGRQRCRRWLANLGVDDVVEFRPHSPRTSCSGGTALPTSSASPRTPSRSGSSPWRPRPAVVRWWPPTSGVCDTPSRTGTPGSWSPIMTRASGRARWPRSSTTRTPQPGSGPTARCTRPGSAGTTPRPPPCGPTRRHGMALRHSDRG